MKSASEFSLLTPSQRRFSGVELLVALVLLLGSFPFVEHVKGGNLIISILLSLVLISAVPASAGRGSILITASVLALPALIGRWINYYRPDLLPPEIFQVGSIVFVLFVIGNLLLFILRAPVVNAEVLCASISAYLLLGLLWTFAYWLVAELIPGAFVFNSSPGMEASIKGFNGLYFSFITLSTVGYGDITPASNVTRMLAAMEAVTGLLYVAVLIARLVAIHATPKSHDS
jgi:hypothetical protein